MDLHNMLHFYTPWIRQKTRAFLTFSGGVQMEHWYEVEYLTMSKKKKKKKTDGDLLASNFSMIYLNFSMQVIKKEKFVT